MTQPIFTLIAGANGAGKSTLTAGNPEAFGLVPLLDPNTFSRVLSPSSALSPIAAGREVLALAEKYLEKRQSFTVETTLSGKIYLEMLARAERPGYEGLLIDLGTSDVEINLSRIEQRVLNGGHDVPEDDVRRRYLRSLKHLPVAAKRADHTILFDNSTDQGYQLVGILSPRSAQWFDPVPQWAVTLKAGSESWPHQ